MYVDEKVTIWNRIHIDDRDISIFTRWYIYKRME